MNIFSNLSEKSKEKQTKRKTNKKINKKHNSPHLSFHWKGFEKSCTVNLFTLNRIIIESKIQFKLQKKRGKNLIILFFKNTFSSRGQYAHVRGGWSGCVKHLNVLTQHWVCLPFVYLHINKISSLKWNRNFKIL